MYLKTLGWVVRSVSRDEKGFVFENPPVPFLAVLLRKKNTPASCSFKKTCIPWKMQKKNRPGEQPLRFDNFHQLETPETSKTSCLKNWYFPMFSREFFFCDF